MQRDSITKLSAMLSHTPPQRREAEEGRGTREEEEGNTMGKERGRCCGREGKETRVMRTASAGMERRAGGRAGDAGLLFFQHVGGDGPQQWWEGRRLRSSRSCAILADAVSRDPEQLRPF